MITITEFDDTFVLFPLRVKEIVIIMTVCVEKLPLEAKKIVVASYNHKFVIDIALTMIIKTGFDGSFRMRVKNARMETPALLWDSTLFSSAIDPLWLHCEY